MTSNKTTTIMYTLIIAALTAALEGFYYCSMPVTLDNVIGAKNALITAMGSDVATLKDAMEDAQKVNNATKKKGYESAGRSH